MSFELQRLYSRAYRLVIGPERGGQGFAYSNLSAEGTSLRVGFEINRLAAGAANKGTVDLYNVSQATRTALVRGQQIKLDAGYLGLAERLLQGTVFKATTSRQGADIVTRLDVIDGLKSMYYATFDRTYAKNTTLAAILADIARAMEVEPGVVVGLPDRRFRRGYTVHGSCREALATLLHPSGLEFNINNGRLNIMPVGQVLGTAAIVLSPQTGLLGIPSVAQTAVEFEALLNPRLVPGQLVKLVTSNNNTSGYFNIRSCKVAGDTHDSKWSVSGQGVRVTNVKAELSPALGFAYNQAVVPGLI